MAAEDVGSLVVRLEANLDNFTKNMNNAAQKTSVFGDVLKANLLSNAITSGLNKIGSLIGSAADKMGGFLSKGIEAASNLEEVQNVIDTTFGESANAINEFAKSAATAFGLSELSAKKFTGTMGAMLKSTGLTGESVKDMSSSLVGLAGDMASFYNLDPAEAFAKLQSGISGETEPLKQLGINMSVANLEAYALKEGITKAYSAMTQAEQVTLRYNYIMQATSDAQGDFAKTTDSYANQQRIMQLNLENLAVSLGTKVLPTVNALTGAFSGLISGELDIDDFVSRIQEAMEGFFEMLEKNLPQIVKTGTGIVKGLISGAKKLIPEFIKLAAPLIEQFVSKIISKIPEITKSGTNIISKLITAILDKIPEFIDAGAKALISLVNGISDQLPTLIPQIVQVVLDIVQTLIDNIPEFVKAGISFIEGLVNGLLKAIPIIIDAIPEIINSLLDALTKAIPQMIDAGLKLFTSLIEALPDIISNILAKLPQIIDSIITTLLDNIPLIIQAGIDLLTALVENMDEIILAIVEALPQIINSIIDTLTKGDSLTKIIQAGVDLFTALITNIPEIILKIITAIPDIITGIVDAITSKENMEAMGQAGLELLGALFSAVGLPTKAANISMGELTDQEIKDWYEATGGDEAFSVQKVKDWLASRITSGFTGFPSMTKGMIDPGLARFMSGKATGGPVIGGDPYIVGERGPEVFVPKSNGTIIPNDKMGSGIVNNFNIASLVVRDDNDVRLVAKELYNLQSTTVRAGGVA
jgi:phage-related protein